MNKLISIKKSRQLIFGMAVATALAGQAWAQTPEQPPAGASSGDAYRSVDPNKFLLDRGMPYKKGAKPLLEPRIPFLPPSEEDSAAVYVKTFKFSHNTVFDDADLLNHIKEFEDRELTLHQLQEAATKLTRYYREKGFFVARAYIPAQTLEDDVLEISLLEGRHGKFELENNSLVNDKTALGFLNKLNKGDLVRTQGLERQLLLINDLSGARVVSSDVFPGEEVGESDFKVGLAKTPKYTGYATVDNYGTRYTGEHRLGVGFSVNSLTGIGDTLSFSGLVSQTTDLTNYAVNYSRPLGYIGFTGGVGVNKTDYEMAKLEGFEVFGTSHGVNAFVSYPLVKTHMVTRVVQLSTDLRQMHDTSGLESNTEKAEKQNIDFTLKLTESRPTNLFNLPGSLMASIGYSLGSLSMENDVAKNGDVQLDSEGFYNKLTASIGHQQYLVRNLTLQTSVRVQQNLGDNLDGGERVSVAGSNGVRAYEDSELSGDSGYVLSLDLIYSLPKIRAYSHNTFVFLDHASVKKNTKTFNDAPNTRSLNAVGVGYGMNYKNFDLKATYGVGFGSEKEPTVEAEYSTAANKFLFQAVMRF